MTLPRTCTLRRLNRWLPARLARLTTTSGRVPIEVALIVRAALLRQLVRHIRLDVAEARDVDARQRLDEVGAVVLRLELFVVAQVAGCADLDGVIAPVGSKTRGRPPLERIVA